MMRARGAAVLTLLAAFAGDGVQGQDEKGSGSTADAPDNLQEMEEQRAELMRELQRLRKELEQSEARMEASQERIRSLEGELEPPSAADSP